MAQLEQRGEPCVPTGGVSTTATAAGTWREVAERGGEPRDEFTPGVSPGGPYALVSDKGPRLISIFFPSADHFSAARAVTYPLFHSAVLTDSGLIFYCSMTWLVSCAMRGNTGEPKKKQTNKQLIVLTGPKR